MLSVTAFVISKTEPLSDLSILDTSKIIVICNSVFQLGYVQYDSGFDSSQDEAILLLSETSKLALDSPHPPIE